MVSAVNNHQETEPSKKPGITIWPSETCLVSKLVDEFCSWPKESYPELAVIFPTKRLGIYFLAMLAKRNIVFRPPLVTTIENFILNNVESQNFPGIAPDIFQEVLLGGLIKNLSLKHIHRGHENELMQFFFELIESGIGKEAFPKLRQCLTEDLYRSDVHLETLEERIIEIETLYVKFYDSLKELNLLTLPQAVLEGTSVLMREASFSKRFQRLYLVGFTSVSRSLYGFWEHLARQNNICFWFSHPPDLPGLENPLLDLIKVVRRSFAFAQDDGKSHQDEGLVHKNEGLVHKDGDSTHLDEGSPRHSEGKTRSISFDSSSVSRVPEISIYQATTVINEVYGAIYLAIKYLNQGISPSHIGILVTNENTYGEILRTAIKETKLEANLAVPEKLSRTTLGTWLLGLKSFIFSSSDRMSLASFLCHPYTIHFLRECSTEFQGLDQLTLRAKVSEKCLEFGSRQKVNTETDSFSLAMTRLEEILRTFSTKDKMTLSGWLGSLINLLDSLYIRNDTHLDDLKSSFLSLSSYSLNEYSLTDFFPILFEHLLEQTVHDKGEPFFGVQIINLSEARYIPFYVVIILGCLEGSFPRRLPPDYLIDAYLKKRTGLRGSVHLEALEDITFGLMKSRLSKLDLFYPLTQLGEPAVRSRFIERLISEENLCVTEIKNESYDLLTSVSSIIETNGCLASPHGQYSGNRPQLFETMSATSVEKLLRCPYSFLLYKLGITDLRLPIGEDPILEGNYLHQILESFFTGESAGIKYLPPLNEMKKDRGFFETAADRLTFLSDKIMPAHLKSHPNYLNLISFCWPRFVDHLTRVLDLPKNKWDGYKELKIPPHPEMDLTINGVNSKIIGSIDSVDFLAGNFYLVTDYKRIKNPSSAEVQHLYKPQLIFYALALDRTSKIPANQTSDFSLADAIFGYWNIIKGEFETRAVGQNAVELARKHELIGPRIKPKSIEDLLAALLDAWTWRQTCLLNSGESFSVDTTFCDYCPYPNICRKEAPDFIEAASELKSLEKFQERSNA